MQFYNTGFQYQNPYQTPQAQNNGIISVRNESEARSYPLAPGHSLMFKDESEPFIYVKTMGISQFDSPVFEKFRLVKEETAEASVQPSEYITRAEFESFKQSILEGNDNDK